MKKLIASILAMFILNIAFAQKGTISPERRLGEIKFYHDNELMKNSDVKEMLKVNTGALEVYKKGRTGIIFGGITGVIGGGMMGWTLGQVLTGEDPNWEIFGVGAGVAVLSFVIYEGGANKAEQGVRLYNEGLPYAGAYSRTELRVLSDRNGIGLSLGF